VTSCANRRRAYASVASSPSRRSRSRLWCAQTRSAPSQSARLQRRSSYAPPHGRAEATRPLGRRPPTAHRASRSSLSTRRAYDGCTARRWPSTHAIQPLAEPRIVDCLAPTRRELWRLPESVVAQPARASRGRTPCRPLAIDNAETSASHSARRASRLRTTRGWPRKLNSVRRPACSSRALGARRRTSGLSTGVLATGPVRTP
jgi:hypothetical protein